MFHDEDSDDPTFSDTIELDLGSVVPSIAGPEAPAGPDRPDRREGRLPRVAARSSTRAPPRSSATRHDKAVADSFPASDPPADDHEASAASREQHGAGRRDRSRTARRTASTVTLEDGTETDARPRPRRDRGDHELHEHLEPLGDARRRPPREEGGRGGPRAQAVGQDVAGAGLDRRDRVPGARRARRVPGQARLQPRRLRLHDLHRELGTAAGGDLRGGRPRTTSSSAPCSRATATSRGASTRTCATTTWPRRRSASPTRSPAGWTSTSSRSRSARARTARTSTCRTSGRSSAEIKDTVAEAVRSEMFKEGYSDVFEGDERWQGLDTPDGDRYTWPDSTYVRKPSFFEGMDEEPADVQPIEGARVLAVLGDSVTTDHISPAGAIKKASPAGEWLIENGVEPGDFNSYGVAARQPRGDDPRDLREHPASQRAGREGGRLHARPRRRGDDDLRGRDGLRRGRRPAGRARRQGVRLGLVARLGGEGHRRSSASAP